MKKLFTQVVLKNGENKDVYVCVDDETAKVLEQVDEVTRKAYLQDEWEMKMVENYHRRNEQSLEKSTDNGFDLADESQDVEAKAIKEVEQANIHTAISKLNPQQQWIVKQVFIRRRKQVDVAIEMGIGESALSQRISVIKAKMKKILKNF